MSKINKMKKTIKYFMFFILANIIIGCTYSIPMVYYGPMVNIKEMLVTTAMSTFRHQYIVKWFLSDQEIAEIMARNKVNDTGRSRVDDIQVMSSDTQESKEHSLDGIEKIDINEDGMKGKLLIIKDSKRVFLGITQNLGSYGEKLDDMCQRYGAVAGINAGGFEDENGQGNGGTPTGIVVKDGEIKFKPQESSIGSTYKEGDAISIIGFNSKGILILGQYTIDELKAMDIKDAVSFSPFFILNGKGTIKSGNGGGGIHPRTVIGQRKDGAVMFLVLDGRQLSTLGATYRQEQDVMLKYGAYNAANLDGGSSTTMFYNNSIINNPSSNDGVRFISTAFLVK
ncbi:phosphodiester glycosidase family protein [Inconstantimicrobium mannanitabidum]|uniref:Exopolysaccharide biosynthesis protein n=1 Tax=Inconstantimicrobium mannanitabidum TaxID=1604901 RepID=A0ACB5RG90_9CLOT|nr:phosphodiester glycosidase family protein [Clostridium sp. TW13]GKX68102.1 exopolysaccharide biosynthesis protein [Clostridium sp. TW13]